MLVDRSRTKLSNVKHGLLIRSTIRLHDRVNRLVATNDFNEAFEFCLHLVIGALCSRILFEELCHRLAEEWVAGGLWLGDW